MRKVIRVNPKTHMMCIPEEIAEDGLVGDVESFPNAVTLTLVMPGATLEDVTSSLERTLEDIRHRMRFAERVKDNPESYHKRIHKEPRKPKTKSLGDKLAEMRQNILGGK